MKGLSGPFTLRPTSVAWSGVWRKFAHPQVSLNEVLSILLSRCWAVKLRNRGIESQIFFFYFIQPQFLLRIEYHSFGKQNLCPLHKKVPLTPPLMLIPTLNIIPSFRFLVNLPFIFALSNSEKFSFSKKFISIPDFPTSTSTVFGSA